MRVYKVKSVVESKSKFSNVFRKFNNFFEHLTTQQLIVKFDLIHGFDLINNKISFQFVIVNSLYIK